MRRTASALGAAALAASLAGCVHSSPTPSPDEGAWARARDENTRSVQLYDELAMRAFATATWQAPAVRAARVERVAAWKAMSPGERAALQASEDAAGAEFDEFVVSLLTADRADNDLDAPQSTWRTAIVREGAPDALPEKVESLTIDSQLRTLYPRIGDFDTVYRVRFRRAAGAPLGDRRFTLRIASARGRMDFAFGPGTYDPGQHPPRRPDAPPPPPGR